MTSRLASRAMQVERKVPDEAQVADHATTKNKLPESQQSTKILMVSNGNGWIMCLIFSGDYCTLLFVLCMFLVILYWLRRLKLSYFFKMFWTWHFEHRHVRCTILRWSLACIWWTIMWGVLKMEGSPKTIDFNTKMVQNGLGLEDLGVLPF